MDRPRHWSRQALAALTATAALGAGLITAGAAQAAPSQAGRIQGGVEDGTFSAVCLSGTTPTPPTQVLGATSYRGAIGDRLVRILVPYNIATHPTGNALTCLTNYLKAAQGKAKVEVSLSRSGSTGDNPSVADYTKAVDALAKANGRYIAYLTAWNEPNNPSYLKTDHPASKAGHFYLIANKVFRNKVVAGDFASGVGAAFLDEYIKALGNTRPGIWALHPYTDVTNFQYYYSQQPANHKDPQAAGRRAAGSSKVLQFARLLGRNHYGPGTQIWLNEIYVDHTADKCAPGYPKGTCEGKGTTKFLPRNQGYAALFLSGGLGADSLPGVLAHQNLPQLTHYVYLRAWDSATDKQLPDADVLQIHFPTCVYDTLAGNGNKPAPQCS